MPHDTGLPLSRLHIPDIQREIVRRAIDRLRQQWPTVTLVHTPVHASWLNQIEIYFSILQRKLLSPSNFASFDELRHSLLCFQDYLPSRCPPSRMEIHPA